MWFPLSSGPLVLRFFPVLYFCWRSLDPLCRPDASAVSVQRDYSHRPPVHTFDGEIFGDSRFRVTSDSFFRPLRNPRDSSEKMFPPFLVFFFSVFLVQLLSGPCSRARRSSLEANLLDHFRFFPFFLIVLPMQLVGCHADNCGRFSPCTEVLIRPLLYPFGPDSVHGVARTCPSLAR